MLNRTHRIRATEFPDFRTPGKIFTGGVLRIKFIRGDTPIKAAVVVGKKSYKTNVERNTFRRRVYSVLTSNMKQLDEKGGIIVVSPLKKVEEIRMELIEQDVSRFIASNI